MSAILELGCKLTRQKIVGLIDFGRTFNQRSLKMLTVRKLSAPVARLEPSARGVIPTGVAAFADAVEGLIEGVDAADGGRATIPSSHEGHPRPPIHSGGSWPLYMLLGRHRCLRNSRPAWCSATSFRYSTSSLVHGCWPVPSNHHLGWPSCS